MKLLYQQMLAIFGVIFVTMAIVSVLFIRSTAANVWDNSFNQLAQYTDVLEGNALKADVSRNVYVPNTDFIQNAEKILSNQRVHFMIYNADNEAVYPNLEGNTVNAISKSTWKELKKGNPVALPELTTNPRDGKQQSMTIYYKPVYLSGKLLFVIAAFAPVDNIQSSIRKTEYNLFIAFLLSALVAIVVSYFVARYQVDRINRLRQVTHQVAEGDYEVDVQLKSKGHDEVAGLAADFQDMIASLRASQTEIHRQEERRRQFMADAAHEMRTPLTTINGLLEGLAYDAIPEESKGDSIALMQKETKRLIRLVNENLDYEKIRTNQILLKKTTFNATETLQDILSQLTQKAQTAGDTLVLDAASDVSVYADKDRFVQVLFNITQNAIQFTQNGTITISAKTGYHQTELTVADTGIGMSPDQVQNIWERYYKADPSRKNTQYGESGLGLAIVHQLVTLHGGTITVDSTLGEGTTFTLTFPDAETAPEQAPITHTT
ncbi:sensor histidine kinase [Lacticaseibacillus daqingensis]|uniref:sensor histidine kinase n=1 Tax=Lacticaseibacillus daqingensis TaxID=2486014 RepID=UPI000F787158|nr:HAMP domain-containing sensor histidine kinase [Lacticaseibacillus daqingensis]